MTDIRAALMLLTDSAEEAHIAAGMLHRSTHTTDHGDFHTIGVAAHALLTALDRLTEQLADTVPRYGDTRILTDDASADPAARLADATLHLHQAHAALQVATSAIRSYNGTITHIAVTADLNATEAP